MTGYLSHGVYSIFFSLTRSLTRSLEGTENLNIYNVKMNIIRSSSSSTRRRVHTHTHCVSEREEKEKNQQRCCVQSMNVENFKGISSFLFVIFTDYSIVVQFIIQPKISDDILSLNFVDGNKHKIFFILTFLHTTTTTSTGRE